MTTTALRGTVEVLGAPGDRHDEILTAEALEFLGRLDAAFAGRRLRVLTERRRRAERAASGIPLDFPLTGRAIRADATWRVAPPAPGLVDRRVEITGPPERRTAVNALTSGAQVWMADFEDATSPTWNNIIGGQLTLLDAVARRIGLTTPEGTENRLRENARLATIAVRPRGWHLVEKHLVVDERPLSASLVDFGLYFFHCAQRQIDAGHGPYFSLPKLENREDARLWNDVFLLAQDLLGIPRGTIRATVLIETVPAAFEMEEILYELREHSAGLTAGRWDYLFSLIKTLGHRSDFVLADRSQITMTAPFLRAYTDLLVRTCHKRGAHAIGGMAAQIPRDDTAADEAAFAAVRLDKGREAEDGFDGTWVAHPGLVELSRTAFDEVLDGRPHQLDRTRGDVDVVAADLLAVPRSGGAPSAEGLRTNVSIALRYFDAWLRGTGAVALNGLVEDASTAEIARAQIWQWIRHQAVSREDVRRVVAEEAGALSAEYPWARVDDVCAIFERASLTRDLPAFFTTDAYARHLVTTAGGRS
ncbi:malate synthase A [Streptomyces sp. NPDC004111]|uniref:malate synthase A n=1 Tax=Streptomyces sp. NPDC004111 TaxID=3364690 RepID=UPI0036A15ACF